MNFETLINLIDLQQSTIEGGLVHAQKTSKCYAVRLTSTYPVKRENSTLRVDLSWAIPTRAFPKKHKSYHYYAPPSDYIVVPSGSCAQPPGWHRASTSARTLSVGNLASVLQLGTKPVITVKTSSRQACFLGPGWR